MLFIVLVLPSLPKRTFSKTVPLPIRLKFWNINPILPLVLLVTVTDPEYGFTKPPIVLKKVVLPAPLEPIIPRVCPLGIIRSSIFKTSLSSPGYLTFRFLTSISARSGYD